MLRRGLGNKLSNCESIYLERVDDVSDEMINYIDMGDFGIRLLVIGQESLHLLGGASVNSCNRTSNVELY